MSETTAQHAGDSANFPAGSEDVARLQKEIADLRREAADRRVAARTAEAEAASAKNRVAELEPYETSLREEVESLKRDVGDKSAAVDGLNPSQALRVLRTLKAAAAGPGAARSTTAGNPPPVATGQPDFSRMTPEDVRQFFRDLPIEQVRQIAEQQGLSTRRRNVFG